ncbi:MAG TPA: nucleotidyltransferase family protein [Candidatus Limnocylindrales bacterium]
MIEADRVAAVVLAAGASSRFGGQKLLAPLAGTPVLGHVLSAAANLGLAETILVLGRDAGAVANAVPEAGEPRVRVVRNPEPERGLSSSLRLGLDAVGPAVDAALILLGDQPLVRPAVIAALFEAWEAAGPPLVVPRYAGGGGPNPVLIARGAWPLAAEVRGDRGLGPVMARRPDLVRQVPVQGDNPDVDTPADLASLTLPSAAP